MSISQQTQSKSEDSIDVVGMLGALLDYYLLIIVVTGFFTAMGMFYVSMAEPIYQSDALIQIESKKSGIAGIERLMDLTGGKEAEAATETELIKSRFVIGKAVDRLQLDIDVQPRRFKMIGSYMARRFSETNKNMIADPPLKKYGFDYGSEYDWGGSEISVSQIQVPEKLVDRRMTLIAGENRKYQLFSFGRLLLEGTVGELVAKDGIFIEVDRLIGRPGTQFIVIKKSRLQTINRYRGGLVVIERGRRTGMISMSMKSTNYKFANKVLNEIATQYVSQNIERTAAEAANSLKFMREQLPLVREEMDRATTALNTYQVSAKSVDITTETKAVLEQLVRLDTEISDMKLKQVDIAMRFTRQHPSYQVLLEQLVEMEAKKKMLEQKVEELPATQQTLLRLQRDMDVSMKIYTTMLNKEQELDVVRAGTVGNARIIDTAEAKLVGPKVQLTILISFLLGFGFSCILVWAHVVMTRGIENPEDIEKMGLVVNGVIPYSVLQIAAEKNKGKNGDKFFRLPLLAVTHPTDPAVEAIRSLRTSLYFLLQDARNNIVMISGPSPLVGKTFISVNMAVAMAQAGKKVLLIDADMRKGYMHRYFDTTDKNLGFSNLLQQSAAIKDVVVHTEIEGLDFIRRGPAADNPSELLLKPTFSKLLKHFSENYDLVVIDTPPIMAVADALIVSKLAGINFIVTRFSKNPIGEVRATIKRFESNGVKLTGAILNATQKRSLAYYGYQKYAYGNYMYEYKSDVDKYGKFVGKIMAKRRLLFDGKIIR